METYLVHHGVQGQKWGERRYQYEDGSLTPEGRRHYGIGERKEASMKKANELRKQADDIYKRLDSSPDGKIIEKYFNRPASEIDYDDDDYVDVPEKIDAALERWNHDNIKEIRKAESLIQDANWLEGESKAVTAGAGAFVGAMAALPLRALTKAATMGMEDGMKRAAIVAGVTLSSITAGAVWGIASDKKLQKDAQKKYGLR